MIVPCSNLGCLGLANVAGVYCDECDAFRMLEGWSRTRDEAWLAYKTSPEIDATPLPGRTYSYRRNLLLVKGSKA
ncbi:hypothetical protein QFZ23_003649 [Arthrobacter globiformis]|nr:hypothetical protein [Arthrobacter globiformis]